jgi:1,4-dihydroxy-2-naphthoate octaprenyltransferase
MGSEAQPPPGPSRDPHPTGWRLWLAGARPRTLPAAVVPVAVGVASVADPDAPGAGVVVWRAVAAMAVALALQVGTNYANDYSDGKRGTDAADRVGPLRLVGSGAAAAEAVKRAAMVSFAAAGLAGLTLVVATSWWLAPLGAVCVAAGWFYTGGPRPYGYAGLGEVFVFVFFGVVATTGAAWVQHETWSWLSVAVSVPVGALATALLVVNNLRDIPSDTRAGKHTLAVKLGDSRTRWLYAALVAGALVAGPVIAVAAGRPGVVLVVVAAVPAWPAVQAVRAGAVGPALIAVLGATGRVQLVFGAALTAGLVLSA